MGGEGFIWGINGHPGGIVYKEDAINSNQQMTLLKNLGVQWYRNDWWNVSDAGRYDMIVEAAEKNNLHLLPIISTYDSRTFATATSTQLHDTAYSFAYRISSRYKGRLNYYELDNELDNKCIKQDVSGYLTSHYDEAILRGLDEGVRQGDPQARTLVNAAGWLHYGFFDRLLADGFNFDILGWQYYSGDITDVSSLHINVAQKLASYGKDIWVTENNIQNGTYGNSEQQQADYIAKTAQQISKLPGFKAYFVYELLDELNFDTTKPQEAHYGLIKTKLVDNRWQVDSLKLAFNAYKNLISSSLATSPSSPKASLTPSSSPGDSFSAVPSAASSAGLTASPKSSSAPSVSPSPSSISISKKLNQSFQAGVENVNSSKKSRWLFNLIGGILILAGSIYLWRSFRKRKFS